MNARLLRSPAALLPAAALAAAAFLAARGALGAGALEPAARAARLASGWALLAALLAAGAYLLRKHMHRRGYSPEFRMRVPIEALERAQARLAALRRDVARGALADARAVRQAAQSALSREGVQRVLRVRVRPGAPGEARFVLSTQKTFPLLHSARWIRGHLHLGLAFAILLLLHGGAPRSGLGWSILALGVLVVASGLVGIAQWMRGPARLTELERDLSIEETFALGQHLERKLEQALAALAPGLAGQVRACAAEPAGRARAGALLAGAPLEGPERELLEDALVLAGQRARVEREYRTLARARLAMHAWRVLHLPAVWLLLVLVGLHLWAVWRY